MALADLTLLASHLSSARRSKPFGTMAGLFHWDVHRYISQAGHD